MIAGLVMVVAAAAMALGEGAISPARHLLILPAAGVALARGSTAGATAGLLAALLQAPMALPLVEAEGLGGRGLDGCAAMALPPILGLVLGRMADELRGRASRLRGMLSIQQALATGDPPAIEGQLEAVAEHVRRALGVSRAGIAIAGPGAEANTVSAPPGAAPCPRSAVAWVGRTGTGLAIPDLGTDRRFGDPEAGPRPVRGLALPLCAGAARLGVLAVEMPGDLPPGTRAAAREIAMHLALALENARLGLRQRRFAEELEGKVDAATQSLRELDRAKSEFISVVSHELRTPLTAIQGFAELLLTREVSAERARTWLGHIRGEAQRLARIVDTLLDLGRIERGGAIEVDCAPVDLGAVISRNVDFFAATNPRHSFAAGPPVRRPVIVRADADALDRVVQNLLSNAVKYSPGGGRVTVALGPAPTHPGMVELSVEDEGVGIPAESMPRVFDKYVRLSAPATSGVRGLGLGLSLVRALVEAHGGAVGVQAAPGRGTRFWVRLPL